VRCLLYWVNFCRGKRKRNTMKIRVSQLRRMVREEAGRSKKHRITERLGGKEAIRREQRAAFSQSSQYDEIIAALADFCQNYGGDPLECIDELKVDVEDMLFNGEFYDDPGSIEV